MMEERLDQIRYKKYYDIVGSLPLELLLKIVEDLEPADIVRSQRVSKQWRSILSSDAITKFVLRQTLAFLNIDRADIPVTDAKAYFRWQHGLQYGQPVKRIFLPWTEPPRVPNEIAYHSRRLVCHNEGVKKVEMLDLETGQRSAWVEEDAGEDEDWEELLTSDRYVALLRDSFSYYLTAWDIHTSQRSVVELGMAEYRTSIHKDKIVIVDNDQWPNNPMFIWDPNSNHLKNIGSFSNLWLWHVEADENMLVAFEIDWDTYPLEVQQTKWTLTGQLLDRTHLHLSLPGNRIDKKHIRTLFNGGPLSYGHKTMRRLVTKSDRKHITMDLMYDYTIDKLSVRWNDCTQPIYDYLYSATYALLTPHIAYHWDREFRWLEIFNADSQVTAMRPYEWDVREVAAQKWFAASSPRLPNQQKPRLLPFGDREVFGLVSEDGIQIWFFNPNFTPDLAGAEPFIAATETG
ncbi:hypothetical protein VTN49DRAFT_7681 [Thermomyces lanuginosus]|uniref:uncharacterized protein n=1 Tax=Thermomyces lanuginosus TaxID=5541 RepID=UPI00374478CF